MQKYSVNQYFVNNILNWVQTKQIVIPEIQRPFVWDSTKVRDLMDSLYKGFPIGFIITWKNPDIRLKDGSTSAGRTILIDGQQRITAMRAAILGEKIINKEYSEERITISFNPQTQEFATKTPAIEKDKRWFTDIAKIMQPGASLFTIVDEYCTQNADVDRNVVAKHIEQLLQINNRQVGYIQLDDSLDIETVTEVFIRINSKGVVLNQADFAMSKIASYDSEDNFGVNLRKCIDYFCHLAREPHFYKHISENDVEFANTIYLSKISWLKNEKDGLYDPDYADVLRVAFLHKFERGVLSDLVSLLSGRNFEKRTFEKEIVDKSFQTLRDGVLDFVNEYSFKQFLMIMRSAGFITPDLVSSQYAMNFAYALYLKLKDQKMHDGTIQSIVRRWYVASTLTGRYSGAAESVLDADMKNIVAHGAEKALADLEASHLSDSFWNITLVQELEKSSMNNPYINTFFAAQIHGDDKGFLSTEISVQDMTLLRGDIHHIYPKNYLKVKFTSRNDYNQIANYVFAETPINIKVADKAPEVYMKELIDQCDNKKVKYGNITDLDELKANLEMHCIPDIIWQGNLDNYEEFLEKRRHLMAQKMRKYYKSL